MNISIFGVGYVGAVSTGCLSSMGHRIIAVDVNEEKVDMLNKGIAPVFEADLTRLIKNGRKKGLIEATADSNYAIKNTEISLICVGTPGRTNGSLNTKFIEQVCRQLGESLKAKKEDHIVVFRSTMLPGTIRDLIIPLLEKISTKKEGDGFFVAFNPEFLREATAVLDFYNPPKTVIGSDHPAISKRLFDIYRDLPGEMLETSLEVAEMVKYVDNNFHALKVTFANEVGSICKKMGVDSNDVMNIFMKDTKLNISAKYLKPGFAFGGSCLPKDLRAITYMAKMLDLETPLLNSILNSNNNQILSTIKRIISFGKKKIGFAGFSFKAGTDDLRESPIIDIIETLLGKGYDLKLYDKNVSWAKLLGSNREYINNRIPHISSLMVNSLDELIQDRELIIIANSDKEFIRILQEASKDQIVFDLVGINNTRKKRENYEGIYW